MQKTSFSSNALSLNDSITHGTKAAIEAANKSLKAEDKIIDLSIGTLDMPTDTRIDEGVCEFIRQDADIIHAFAPVKGFQFLRESIAARTYRLHQIFFDPKTEIIVTPGGIKGALTVMFHTFLNPDDEVIVPVPNWPHYADMLKLHGAIPKTVLAHSSPKEGLMPPVLDQAITDKTKLIILGDCINPTGKVYTSEELYSIAQIIAKHNIVRVASGKSSAIHVIFDCPYEAHVFGARAKTFAAIDVRLPNGEIYSMRQCTITVTGPGKTYGMHGDRLGYALAVKSIIDMAERVQVNLNSFASTYAQVATNIAMQEYMDEVATDRAQNARNGLNQMLKKLNNIPLLRIDNPDGGYFIFADFSKYAQFYQERGYENADMFLLNEARVATINGCHFVEGAENAEHFRHLVRINCGRSLDLLNQASDRIEKALSALRHEESLLPLPVYV